MPSNHFTLCLPLLLPSVFPSIRVFPMSQFFVSGGQSIRTSASASILPTNMLDWFTLVLTGLISLLSKRLSRVLSSATVQNISSLAPSFLYGPTLTSILEDTETHSSALAWRTQWTEEPGGPQSMGLQRVRHYPATKHLTYMTTGKTTALTRQTCVGKAMPLLFNVVWVGHSFSSKEQASFNLMGAVDICTDFGAQENKVSHCFHCFPIYLLWSDGTGCHDLHFLNAEF